MARILDRFEAQQTSTRLISPTIEFIQALAPAVKYAPIRMAFELADNKIVNPILGQIIGGLGNRLLNAFVRTTAAVVSIQAGGGAQNVLPLQGTITVNFRTLPGDEVKQYVDQIIQKESVSGNARAEKILSGFPPSSVTPASGPNYDLIVRAIMETFSPDPKVSKQKLIVAPMLIVGGTDALWYEEMSKGKAFRFNPMKIESSKNDIERIHGVDERIHVERYLDAVRFYMRFIKLAAGDEESGVATA
jgi:carboxypeptidase PM20D1